VRGGDGSSSPSGCSFLTAPLDSPLAAAPWSPKVSLGSQPSRSDVPQYVRESGSFSGPNSSSRSSSWYRKAAYVEPIWVRSRHFGSSICRPSEALRVNKANSARFFLSPALGLPPAAALPKSNCQRSRRAERPRIVCAIAVRICPLWAHKSTPGKRSLVAGLSNNG
jgi:hypothetical protein